MIVEIREEGNQPSIKVGDIFSVEGHDHYLLTKIGDDFSLRNLNGRSAFTSGHGSIESMLEYMNKFKYNFTVYSQEKYKIVLEKI